MAPDKQTSDWERHKRPQGQNNIPSSAWDKNVFFSLTDQTILKYITYWIIRKGCANLLVHDNFFERLDFFFTKTLDAI